MRRINLKKHTVASQKNYAIYNTFF